MEIYILRHAIAEDAAPGQSDARRALTKEGRERLARVLVRAKEASVRPALILSSPYVRAIETAEAAAKHLGYSGAIVRTEALIPSSSPQAVWDEIRQHRTEEQLLLSGHEPLLSQCVAFLLGCPALRLELKKSALVRIDMDSLRGAPQGILKWMLIPRIAG